MMTENTINYCAHCGAEVIQKKHTGQLRPVCPACGRVHFDDPKVAVGVLIIENNKVLLIRRVMLPQKGKWTLPGGFMDAGEVPEEAAARESCEETGIDVEIGELLELITGKEHVRGADLMLVYRGRTAGGTLLAGDDADRAAWFAADELPPLAFQTNQLVLEKYFLSSLLND